MQYGNAVWIISIFFSKRLLNLSNRADPGYVFKRIRLTVKNKLYAIFALSKEIVE